MSDPETLREKGAYLGTEIDAKWWKRYTKGGFFARGNGEYWLDAEGFCFRRYLTREPLRIPYCQMQEIALGKWHAGRWCLGRWVLKIVWEKDGLRLSSGFLVPGSREQGPVLRLKAELKKRMGQAGVAGAQEPAGP